MKSPEIYGDIIVIKDNAEKYSDLTSLPIQPQHWGGEHQLNLYGFALNYFKNDNIVREVNPPSAFISYLIHMLP